ncbi:MAG: DUF177 domain-containing protein [Proteobacteria bacterium]|nr:DUF177 domain-containing protein [Pseudomonadota bacterium]
MTQPPEYSILVVIESLPKDGRRYDIRPSTLERRAIADRLNIDELDPFSGSLTLVPTPGREYQLEGTLNADVRQTCVVTGDPLSNHLEMTVYRRFTTAPLEPDAADDEDEATDAALELPEPLETDTLDIGEIAVEELALSVDPYPRTPGLPYVEINVDPPKKRGSPAQPESPASPFAALAELKKKMESDK